MRTLLDELELTPREHGSAPAAWRSSLASQLADELDAVADALRVLAEAESASALSSVTSARGQGAAREFAALRTATR